MKRNIVLLVLFISSFGLAACASVKDENGKTVGTCIGAGCVLRAAFGANTVDSKTGHLKGTIPLFSVGGASAPSSAPAASSTQEGAS
jgi:hypothetical protein